ncbi:nitrate/nitrite two-component system sensor histidine kinase NarQ [Erwinia sp. CPCC 100877]|nr:nitrate/nitrite two-component system sensor histidine kinase NarQ [Erwinia sp. CPCC 100877]
MVKRPVSASLARAFFSIVLLSLLTTGAALFTLSSSMRDAEAVNIAGSLRMQSYRLGYDLQGDPGALALHREQYAQTLKASVLQALESPLTPREVSQRYRALHDNWRQMDLRLAQGDRQWYQANIVDYVSQIDLFVLALQHHAEYKMEMMIAVSALGFLAIITLVFFTLGRIRRQVVAPLNALVSASESIERGDFDHPQLDSSLPNELGWLAHSFTRMSGELHKLYRRLEESVQEKTLSLQEANRQLEVLYGCSQAMTISVPDNQNFQNALHIILRHEPICALEMQVGDYWCLSVGQSRDGLSWQSTPIRQQQQTIGHLRWQAPDTQPALQLMDSVASMLGRGIWLLQAQKQHQQLLLMEERATIARELHDSLAQVLSYLRIQIALLRRAVPEENQRAGAIISDFTRALDDATRQLRALLSTFRLTLQQANLPEALQEMIAPLRDRSEADIELTCNLADQALDAPRQVHLLQIIREAVLNAIRHASARHIRVSCYSAAPNRYIAEIVDDGRGIPSLEEPEGHYGLNIMQERADCLGGELTISCLPEGGTRVRVSFPNTADDTTAQAEFRP